MKVLLAIVLLTVSCWAGTCGAGYGYFRAITIDHTSVPAVLTNFPFLLSGTFTWMKTEANGGQVKNTAAGYTAPTVPADLIFCTAPTSGDAVPFEVDNYSATTGVAQLWVSLSLSNVTDTVIYAFYGKLSVVTSQEQATTVWSNAGYVSVYHFTDQSTNVKDSGPGANNLTYIGTHSSTTGQVGFAIVGGSTVGIAKNTSPSGLPGGTSARAIESWIKFIGGGTGNDPAAIGYWGYYSCGTFNCSGAGQAWGLQFLQGDTSPLKGGVYDTPCAFAESGPNCSGIAQTTGTVSSSVWHKIIGQSAAGNTSMASANVYVDGAVQTTTVQSVGGVDAINTATNEIRIGAAMGCGDQGATACFLGASPIDEFRIASTTFSANWNQYEYCNDIGSCTATVGAEQTITAQPFNFVTTHLRDIVGAGKDSAKL